MNLDNDLIKNIEKIHTTEFRILRIKRNLELENDDVVKWSKQEIKKRKKLVCGG